MNELTHLNNVVMFTNHMVARAQYPSAPVILMGDLNAGENQESQRLLKEGSLFAYDQQWIVPVTFVDTFREANGPDADARTLGSYRLDYVYTEDRGGVFGSVGASVRRDAPGGSDHWPIMAEVEWYGGE